MIDMNFPQGLPEPPYDFDPEEEFQVDQLLETYRVQISRVENSWHVYWRGGVGEACPVFHDDPGGKRARAIIALSVYLQLAGVNLALCDTMAYWYIQGPHRMSNPVVDMMKCEKAES